MFDWNYYKFICNFGEWVVAQTEHFKSKNSRRLSTEELLVRQTKEHRFNEKNSYVDTLHYYRRMILPDYIDWFLSWNERWYNNKCKLMNHTQQFPKIMKELNREDIIVCP
jgi:hypothetical protein